MTTMPAVHLVGADFGYDTAVALADVDLDVPPGASVALLGTNGSGKTTLLKALVGLLLPRRGVAQVFGDDPRSARPQVGYLRQQAWSSRIAPMTVRDAVRIGRFARLGWFGRETREDRAAVDDALDRLGIADLAGRSLHELSGGQRQRVQLAQVLAQQARLLLLDEPFTGLDPPTQQQLSQILAEEHNRGTTVITATHELAVARSCDLVVLLGGRVIAAGTPQLVCTDANLIATFGPSPGMGSVPALLDHHHHGGTGSDDGTARVTRRRP